MKKSNKVLSILASSLILSALVVAAAGDYISSNSIPDLESASQFQGLSKSKKTSKYLGFPVFTESDEKAWKKAETQYKSKKLTSAKLTWTKENRGGHYIAFNTDTDAQKIFEQTNPSAKAMVIAVYNAKDKLWHITDNEYYKSSQSKKYTDYSKLKIKAGQAAYVVTAASTEIYDAVTLGGFSSKIYPTCEQDNGWHSYFLKEDTLLQPLEDCIDRVKSAHVLSSKDPQKYVKVTDIKNYSTDDFSMAWVNLQTPKVESETPTKVANLKATTNGTKITLTWDAATDDKKVTGYEVLYDTKSHDGDLAKYDFSLDTEGKTTATIEDLNPKTKYYFVVTANDADGNYSTSVEVSATTGEKPAALIEADLDSEPSVCITAGTKNKKIASFQVAGNQDVELTEITLTQAGTTDAKNLTLTLKQGGNIIDSQNLTDGTVKFQNIGFPIAATVQKAFDLLIDLSGSQAEAKTFSFILNTITYEDEDQNSKTLIVNKATSTFTTCK